MSASLAAMSRALTPGLAVLASCSSSPIRQTLTPGGPISRIAVARSPERWTVVMTLSSVRLADIASKPILRAIASSHSRVRTAVFPARSIRTPNHSSTSTASPGAAEIALVSWSKADVTLALGDDARHRDEAPRSCSGFEPRERLILILEIKMLDLRVDEITRDARHGLQDSAVGYGSNAFNLSVVIPDELEMRHECFETAPAGKRPGVHHDAGESPIRRNDWIDLVRELLEVRFLQRPIGSDNQDASVAQQLKVNQRLLHHFVEIMP